jgi:chitodextrinase
MALHTAISRNINKLKKSALITAGVVVAAFSLFIGANRAQAAACGAASADYGTATSTVKIDNTATYQVWSRILAPDTTNNSYSLEIDGNNCYIVGDTGITAGNWTWVDFQNGSTNSKISVDLPAGNHTIKMIGREAGVKLGRVLFVSDANCVPVDTGSNCTVVGDTTSPTVDLTSPQNAATVSGSTDLIATATDNVAVTKVDFLVNGVLAATDTNSPYSYTWDTTKVANGSVNLTAKAYDAAGNTATDTAQVTVSNGDNQAPSTPDGVTAQANAYNKVTVKWAASTDNTAVKGYRVSRDGVTVGDVTTGTQFVDTTVLPSTAYSYQVAAYDAAGNVSGLSTVAKVTTPAPTTIDTQAPSTPTNVQATAVGQTQVNVSWTASTDNVGVAAYDVYRTTGSITAAKVATVSTTSYGDTGLTAGTKYTYYVMARDTAGNISGKSATATAMTAKATKPTKKGGITGTVSYAKKQWWNRPLVMLEVNGHRRVYAVKSDGTYTIKDIPAGTYTVKYVAFGAKTEKVKLKIEAGKTISQNVTLHAR